MKTKKAFSIVAFVFIMIVSLLLSGCHDDPKPDPCKDKTPTSARFVIGERFTYNKFDTLIVSDTVLNEQFISFEAQDENETFEWKIGEDTKVLTGKKVSLWFAASSGGFSLPYTTTVRLIVKKTPNTTCFPKDDGVDTVTQQFTVIGRDKNPLVGTYSGVLKSAPSNIFEIKISYLPYVVGPDGDIYSPFPQFSVSSLVQGCNSQYWWWANVGMTFGYRWARLSDIGSTFKNECRPIRGWIFIDKKGEITIPYSLLSNPIDSPDLEVKIIKKEVFIGRIQK